ncbi:type II secretion system protein [Candidatus Wolfebacteria bacterium]|nr:type II secretion system protein [Candidatus Wolfebacteria bacterium]
MTGDNKKGFTVIELIVVLSVFSIIIATVVGIFVSSLQTQRSAISLVEAEDNIGLALEQMAREIRLGMNYMGSADFKSLSFRNVIGEQISYSVNNTTGQIQRCINVSCQDITPSNINIENFNIRYMKAQPALITINFIISSKDIRLKDIKYQIQTSVSGRNL